MLDRQCPRVVETVTRRLRLHSRTSLRVICQYTEHRTHAPTCGLSSGKSDEQESEVLERRKWFDTVRQDMSPLSHDLVSFACDFQRISPAPGIDAGAVQTPTSQISLVESHSVNPPDTSMLHLHVQ
jgi:hypothetical protein